MTRIVVTGGGTGGHVFPAIAIADALKKVEPGVEILFVGAEGRLEMERVPRAGYRIEGLEMAGFDRRRLWRNAAVVLKAWRAREKAKRIVKAFGPDAAVGVGGYASGPTLSACRALGVPYLLQEQNGYAGVTNKMLAGGAERICVAYDGMERFFPKDKIVMTGNPVRDDLVREETGVAEARKAFGLEADRATVLVVGGSLGAGTINESLMTQLPLVKDSGVQLIWQTGKYYWDDIRARLAEQGEPAGMWAGPFIDDMGLAYKAASVVVSRAGALSISELCLLGKAAILVPSPNVAEDHQTKNAMALVRKGAALCIRDTEARMALVPRAVQLTQDAEERASLEKNIRQLARPHAAREIALAVLSMIEKAAEPPIQN